MVNGEQFIACRDRVKSVYASSKVTEASALVIFVLVVDIKNTASLTVFQGAAERAGFEPANLCGLHAFQACALSQTTRPLLIYNGKIIP